LIKYYLGNRYSFGNSLIIIKQCFQGFHRYFFFKCWKFFGLPLCLDLLFNANISWTLQFMQFLILTGPPWWSELQCSRNVGIKQWIKTWKQPENLSALLNKQNIYYTRARVNKIFNYSDIFLSSIKFLIIRILFFTFTFKFFNHK